MNFKRNNPFLGSHLGSWPSEIRFFNGNGGEGDGEGGLNGGDFGAGIGGVAGEASQAGGAVSTGGVIGGTPGESPSASLDLSLNDAMNILGGAYPSSPAPASAPASAPSSVNDLSKAFNPPGQPIDITTRTEASERAIIDVCRALASQGANFLGWAVDTLLGYVFTFVQGAQIPGFVVRSVERKEKTTIGQELTSWLLMGSQPSTQMRATPSPSVSLPSVRGAPISMTPEGYSGKKSEGNLEPVLSISSLQAGQKAPSSYGSPYYTGYQPLSMSLFQAKGNGGLMIFPTSTAGQEPEMSSLVKKQEPVIDTTSLFFLFGMSVLGLVLRKAARA